MKRLLTATILVTSAIAAQSQTMIDTARVRSAQPQYASTQVPRQECTTRWRSAHDSRSNQAYQDPYQQQQYQQQQYPQQQYPNQDASRSYGGAVLGGLAGGVLGNQVGGGNGKVAATAIGAVLGAMTGDNLDNRNARQAQAYPAPVYQNVDRGGERCQTVYESQSQLTGYQVVYDYRGQSYSTFMRNNPGNSLRVRVSVEPITE